ncbi:MAG: hypothetical protein L3K02_02290 [Thermoplasmata archaeon]|nr:hypothetical protein [Thermoplasmata archaeon]
MHDPRGLRGPSRRRSILRRPTGFVIGALVTAFLAMGGVGGVAFQVTHLNESLTGIQAPTQFLTHWQQVGSESGQIPPFLPRAWSGAVGFPSRLPRLSGAERINPVTVGDQALVWVFNESVGMATSTEIEITFNIHYLVGVTATAASITVYIETQRAAPRATQTFTVYWDSGHAAGVTYVDQIEVAQACVAVGTCP